ncbi:histidine kinase [Alcanivorax sp. N3-2A]|nr:histidine kinase [Alcanivorax sp. N3-2A]|tara:strand:- start:44037 stop:44384 length:348 start_codon:yes stop_codon:yes gene_type:complete
MQQPPVLDTAVIDELREIMGEEFDRLVASFERDGQQRLKALHQAFSADDAEQARQQAHSFKGSSGNLGAARVAALCVEIEQYARGGDLPAAAVLMEALENEFLKACDQLKTPGMA